MKIIQGTRWCKKGADSIEGNTIKVLNFVNESTIRVVDVGSNPNRKSLMYRMQIKALEEDYRLLPPDAYINFNIVELNDNINDIIVTMHKAEDMNTLNTEPYCVMRQNIINIFSNYIKAYDNDYEVGMTMSIESVPEGTDYHIMTACNNIKENIMTAAYLDENLNDLISPIRGARMTLINSTLYWLYKDHIKSIPEQYREEAEQVKNHRGYCQTLYDLMVNTEFMYDYERAFGITKFKDINILESTIRGDTYNGCIIDELAVKKIEKAYGIIMFNPIFISYDMDIDISRISNEKLLIKDETDKLYICAYKGIEGQAPMAGNTL
jgi:hypothetical protein